MRPRPKPLMVLCFVLLMAAIMYVQSPPSPGPSRALKDAAARMKAYFPENPPPKGWQIAAISTRAGAVWVDIKLPEAEVAFLLKPPSLALTKPSAASARRRAISCGESLPLPRISRSGRWPVAKRPFSPSVAGPSTNNPAHGYGRPKSRCRFSVVTFRTVSVVNPPSAVRIFGPVCHSQKGS